MRTCVLACLIVCAITRTLGLEGASNALVSLGSLGSLGSTALRLNPIKNGVKASDKRFGKLTNTSSGDIAIRLNEMYVDSGGYLRTIKFRGHVANCSTDGVYYQRPNHFKDFAEGMSTKMVDAAMLRSVGDLEALRYSDRGSHRLLLFTGHSTPPGVRRIVLTDITKGGHRMVEVFLDTTKEKETALDCNIIGDKALIKKILQDITKDVVEKVTQKRVQYYLNLCDRRKPNKDKSSLKSLFEKIGKKIQRLFIFPGTKWCGAGDVAENDDDLGVLRGTDMCCRAHDNSNDNIPALQTKHGITNNNLYTMTNCKDDRQFYNCLLNDKSVSSTLVRKIFFDVLSIECFSYTYPRKCVKKNPSHNPSKCEKYELDKSAPKKWQIFSPSHFKDYNDRKRSQKNQVRLTIAENDLETVTVNAGVWVKTEEPEDKPVLENENYFGNLVEGKETTPVMSEEPVNN